jgi:hypothetical protein
LESGKLPGSFVSDTAHKREQGTLSCDHQIPRTLPSPGGTCKHIYTQRSFGAAGWLKAHIPKTSPGVQKSNRRTADRNLRIRDWRRASTAMIEPSMHTLFSSATKK